MAGWDTTGPFNYLYSLLAGLTGMQQVYKGPPESFSTQVAAYVALAGQHVADKMTHTLQREANYFIGFVYRVDQAQDTAELTVAGLLDAFITAFFADRTLGGTALSAQLDLSLANEPRYEVIAGQEFRVYPVRVTVRQMQSW